MVNADDTGDSRARISTPASVLRGRTASRVGGHKFVSHAEQVAQDIGCDAGQADQHSVVVEIVVGHVVNIRVCGEQFGAVIETDANGKRTRLSKGNRLPRGWESGVIGGNSRTGTPGGQTRQRRLDLGSEQRAGSL
jgi:hypothetical protein